MDYAGKMADVVRRIDEEIEYLGFTLGGKYFTNGDGDVLQTLSELVDKEIILTVPSSGNVETDWLITNEDHCFIEHIHEIAPGRYEIRLGS